MEDFIKILIWAIIIVSFISSIFRKKNKGKQKADKTHQGVPEISSNIPIKVEQLHKKIEGKDEIDSYNNMLSEIENLFKINENSGKTVSERTEMEDSPKAKTSDKTKIQTHETQKMTAQYDPQWHKETASEHTLITDWSKEEKVLEKKLRWISLLRIKLRNLKK